MAKVTVRGAMGEPHYQADDWNGCPDPYLADLLKRAAKRKMTPAEKRAQRMSFIHGQTGVDKDRILEILDGQQGADEMKPVQRFSINRRNSALTASTESSLDSSIPRLIAASPFTNQYQSRPLLDK